MTNEEPKALAEVIGDSATLEEMAEECNELAHACLKLARYLRGENPVNGKTKEEMIDNLHEEIADAYVSLREVRKIPGLVDNEKIGDTIDFKRKRMYERLGVKADSFIF